MEQPLDLGVCIKSGWDTFTRNAVALIVGTILVAVISGLTLGICAGPMTVGFSAMCIRATRGETVEVNDVFAGFQRFGPAFVMFLLLGIAVAIGCMLLVVPGLVVAFLFCWAPYLMADGENDPIACLRGSLQYNTSNVGPVFVFVLVQGVIAASGSLVALGSLITGPIAAAMMAHGFVRALGSATSGTSE